MINGLGRKNKDQNDGNDSKDRDVLIVAPFILLSSQEGPPACAWRGQSPLLCMEYGRRHRQRDTIPVRSSSMTIEPTWYNNPAIWSPFYAWVLAQLAKLLVTMRKTGDFDHGFLLRLGGMPSSHSAAIVAMATSVGLTAGFGSPVFAVAFALAMVVMIDAQSVRRAAGQQAKLLNQMLEELFKEHHLSQQKLVEFLGHTRMEVLLGAIMGIFAAILCHAYWFTLGL